MKTIKLTALGLLISLFSYGQTDTIIRMVNGTNLSAFNDRSTEILTSTDYYNNGEYKDFVINIDSLQILLLHLYDNCKYCKDGITTRDIEYFVRSTNSVYLESVKSSENIYYINGSHIKNIIIKKPNE